MLTEKERDVLHLALSKYRPGRSGPIHIGDEKLLKPALKLMSFYRLRIEEIKEDAVLTNYTRWLESVQVRGTENQEVYVTFSPRFERIWLESKKHLLDYVNQNPANLGLRSRYSIRLYSWAKKYASVGKKRISLEDLRKVLGLESVKDAGGKIIQEAPLPIWANFRQRALDTAMAENTKKTDLKIAIKLLERSKHRRVTTVIFAIKEQKCRTELVKTRSSTLPDFLEPMKAKLVDSMSSGDWIYEIKFDDYRAVALRGGSETRILYRGTKKICSASFRK